VGKKEVDAYKEANKEERFDKALKIKKEKLHIDQVRVASEQDRAHLKRMLEEERIMTMDISAMAVEEQLYYRSLCGEITICQKDHSSLTELKSIVLFS
jgi:SepF-like predicted cell division protein (DUF552 family)